MSSPMEVPFSHNKCDPESLALKDILSTVNAGTKDYPTNDEDLDEYVSKVKGRI